MPALRAYLRTKAVYDPTAPIGCSRRVKTPMACGQSNILVSENGRSSSSLHIPDPAFGHGVGIEGVGRFRVGPIAEFNHDLTNAEVFSDCILHSKVEVI